MNQSLISYINGRYIHNKFAKVHIEDRGFQFADGIYEVVAQINGQWVDMEWHLDRLEYSMNELKIDMPITRKAIEQIANRLMALNRIRFSGYIYIQITRGTAPRDHVFPSYSQPSIIMTVKRFSPPPFEQAIQGKKVITGPENRWNRPDIKSIALLPNILAKQEAKEAGAIEYWFVKDDKIREGGSSNSWIISKEGELITHPATQDILNGITRRRIIEIAKNQGLKIKERAFSVKEAHEASEAFISSSTKLIAPISQIDEHIINEGKTGKITQSLIKHFYEIYQLI